ncbi:MAG: prepilin-type N-terminal cleavage/methylation domain-containing protein [Coriobacteriia bacterium]|nr:prepilin-type N-terminal cleavage/methylation domain-containing protein [Coriobacteriia bacterium]
MPAHSDNGGFTLVELMVVVLIIGVLVAIAVPTFNVASLAASQRTCQVNQRTIEGAVQQWVAVDSVNTWTAQVIDGATDVLTAAGNEYIKSPPVCPQVDGPLFYAVNAGGTVTADDVASGDAAPAVWTSSTGHDHY